MFISYNPYPSFRFANEEAFQKIERFCSRKINLYICSIEDISRQDLTNYFIQFTAINQI